MSTIKSGKFWTGFVVAIIVCYVWKNYGKGRLG